MSEERPGSAAGAFSGRTAWARSLQTPLRVFLRTETGSAVVLLAAAVAALVWINVSVSSYEAVWGARLSVRLAGAGVSLSLREWVNSGLMTFFFFVFGLEARREFDMGELRQRRRLALPVVAGLGGLIVPVAIYLAINHGSASRGWGAAMSTDTAFALGMLALVQPRFPDRVRAFLLSVAVVDDLVSLVVIGTAYSRDVRLVPLAVAAGVFAVVLMVRRARIRAGTVYALLGVAAWVAVLKSGVDPVVVGLVMGLLTYAYPASRTDLERASDLFRSFREQPTPELARSAGVGLASALSPNERLQLLYHPWTSYVIVPLFALANAGIVISGSFLAAAYTSPITLGILIGYVVGKPVGIAGASWLLARLSRGRLGRRSAGRPSPGSAPLPGSASPSPSSSPRSPSAAPSSRKPSSGSSAPPWARRRLPGWCSGPPPCCLPGCRSAPCWERPSPSSTSAPRSTRTVTTSAARTGPSSPSSSTAISSAPTAARLNPCSASYWPATVTCGTSGGISR